MQPGKGEGYAVWVREMLTAVRQSARPMVSLFDSSVPEPKHLLAPLVANAFEDPLTDRYVSAFASGNPYLHDALSKRYSVPEDCILTWTGAADAIDFICRVFCAPKDHIIVESPGFDIFEASARRNRCAVSKLERDHATGGFDITALKSLVRPNTKLIIISDTHNPTGRALSPFLLEKLVETAEEYGIHVVLDAVYADYSERGFGGRPVSVSSPNLLTVSSLTKIFGLSTLRCGWIMGHPDALAPLEDHRAAFGSSISNLTHAISSLVVEEPSAFAAYTASILGQAQPIMEEVFSEWQRLGISDEAIPPTGPITFPRLIGIDDTREFSQRVFRESGLIVVPGELFGKSGHIRIGFAKPAYDLNKALTILTDAILAERNRLAVSGQRAVG